MQVSIETTKGLERKMTIAVPHEQVDSAVNARLQDAARTVQMDGFRKGKIPLKLIKSKYGKGVRQEVVGELMSQTYYQAISQESLKPAGQPHIEATNLKEGEDLEFTAIFEVYPEISLPDFSKIEAQRLVAELSDADIDEMIQTLRQQRQTWERVERAAAAKDMVNIDYVGRLNGEEFEGGKGSDTNLVLGSERMLPGFEAAIEGKSGGDKFTVALQFPEEYHNSELAGKEVEFSISLNSVQEQALPEIDETFYSSFGIEEGGEAAFREEVTNNMQREMKTASRNKLKNQIMDTLTKIVDVSVPEALMVAEIQLLRKQMLSQMGSSQKVDSSMLPDELFKEQAHRRVVLGLVLGEVIQQQGFKADPAKVRESVEELASTYESPDEVINWYYGNQEQLATIESTVVEDQVFDYIISEAHISDKQVKYQEVIQPETKPAGEQQVKSESES